MVASYLDWSCCIVDVALRVIYPHVSVVAVYLVICACCCLLPSGILPLTSSATHLLV